ncbi:MAG: amidohydrolase [Pseudomonadota bacterium]
MSEAAKTAERWLAQNAGAISDWTATIFDFAEPAWREYRSSAWYVERLRAEGFEVEEGSGGMPTAFCARWGQGEGPVVGLYAEYDAVPGNCQAAAPAKRPRQGLSDLAAGHTDPHSGLGIAGLAGLLATKAAMEAHGIPGGLQFTGEPAEKLRGSKPIHAARGYYDGLAAILSFHPFYMLPLCNTVRWDTQCGAAYSMIYRFRCDAPEMWGARDGAPIPQSHSDVRAPGANDALMMMYQSARLLRDSMASHQGGWSMSEAILGAGQATADNLPALQADLQYMIRVPDLGLAERIAGQLDRLAEHAAGMTACRVEKHWVSKSRPGLTNHAMAQMIWEEMQGVGAPEWSEAGLAMARQVQEACGFEADAAPLIDACTQLISPQEAEAVLRETLPPVQRHATSDDYTDMSWHAPLARFYVARPALKGGPYPAWAMNALGGMQETIDPMVEVASKVLSRGAIRVLTDESLRQRAWTEFETRTGGGVGGADWTAPLADYAPPIEFAWPEYVETVRGRHWWI